MRLRPRHQQRPPRNRRLRSLPRRHRRLLAHRHRLDALPLYGRWARRGPYEMIGSATTVAAFGAR